MSLHPTPPTDDAIDCGEPEGDVRVASRFRIAPPRNEAERAKPRKSRRTDDSESYTSPERSISERFRALAPTIFSQLRVTGHARGELALLAGTIAMLAVFVTACASSYEPPSPGTVRMEARQGAAKATVGRGKEQLTAAQREAIALVKMATAKYHSLSAAQEDGYTSQFPAGCAASPAGAQGIHYLAPARVDTIIELLRPELVMYEPQRDGRLELVGVDYVVPFAAWQHAEPPRLVGVPFMRNEPLGVWALHIWNWRSNPSGTFAMWNPKVSCALATP